MKLSKEEVEHIALLARLGISDEEKEKFAEQISSILDYVEQLKEVDTTGIEPTAQVTGLENLMRLDEVEERSLELKKGLIGQAPKSEDNLVKTKSVF